MRDRAISSKFSTHRVSKECTLCNFQKIFPSPKVAAILNFQIFAKNGKTQICFYLFASISLTVRDRAISSKFSTHRVSEKCTLCNFQKIFPSPKMAAILNFRIFAKNGKTQFYCVNTSYPMDNSLSGRRRPARQTSEKDVLCFHRPGRSSAVHLPDGVWYFLPV